MNQNYSSDLHRPCNCLQGNTIVFNGDKHSRVRNIAGEKINIDTPSGIKKADVAVQTSENLIRLETELGYFIKATPNHRGLVFSDGRTQEKLFKDIKAGDYALVN